MNDLGNFDQALWSAAQGDYAMTVSNFTIVPRSRIGVHANLILLPLSLIYRVTPNPVLLLVLTSAACGAAGVGIFAYARARLGNSPWALVPAFSFWISPIVHDANLYDFHVVTLYTAFLVWAFWALNSSRLWLGFTLLCLALLCKEDVPLIAFMMGIYFLSSGRRQLGIGVCALSAAYLVVLLAFVVPAFDQGRALAEDTGIGARYQWLGSGPTGIASAILEKPGHVLKHALAPERIRILGYLLLIGGLAAFRGWRILLMILPTLALAVLEGGHWMSRITGTYYWIAPMAFICLACVEASASSARIAHLTRKWPLVYLGAACAFFSFLFSPLPHSVWAQWEHYRVTNARSTLLELTSLVPDDAPLCVQNNLGPHLSQRQFITAQPQHCPKADYVIVHLRWLGGPSTGLFVRDAVWTNGTAGRLTTRASRVTQAPNWSLIARRGRFYLFKRGAKATEPPAVTLTHLKRDFQDFEQEQTQAKKHRSFLADYLVGSME